jgi:hypothetical protein
MVGSTTSAGGRGGLQPENGVAARTTNAAFRNRGRHVPNRLNPAIAVKVRTAVVVVTERPR